MFGLTLFHCDPISPSANFTLSRTNFYPHRKLPSPFFQRTSQFLQTELPVRVAHRIKGFRKLPFIVVTNPHILKVVSTINFFQKNSTSSNLIFKMELYIRSFKIITQFNDGKQLKNLDEAEEFSKMLEDLLNVHGTVIDALSTGFRK